MVDNNQPFVSVIIPVYNDPEGLKTTINSIIDQTYSSDRYEILPVDNGSTDDTYKFMSELANQNPELVFPLQESEIKGSYAARNRGIKESKGDILVFIDADMSVTNRFIEEITDSFGSTECDYLGYNVSITTSESPNLFEQYENLLSFPVEHYIKEGRYSPTCALSVRRSVIECIGGFDQDLISGGDKEFGRRVANSGYTQCYNGSINIYHPARNSLAALIKKSKRVGRGHEQVRRRHPELSETRHPFHPIRFLPPNPFRLRSRASSDVNISGVVCTLFYLIAYFLKIVQSISAIQEYLSSRWGL